MVPAYFTVDETGGVTYNTSSKNFIAQPLCKLFVGRNQIIQSYNQSYNPKSL